MIEMAIVEGLSIAFVVRKTNARVPITIFLFLYRLIAEEDTNF